MDGQSDGLVKMDIVTRMQLEIAMQLLITEILWHVRQASQKLDEFMKLKEN